MRTLRRALGALFAAVLVAGFVRLRGTGGTPPRRGGWRELTSDELDDQSPGHDGPDGGGPDGSGQSGVAEAPATG